MKVLLESDSTSLVDIEKSVSVLAILCKNLNFEMLSARQIIDVTPKFIDFEQEIGRIERRFDRDQEDYYVYVTAREYEDSYFHHNQSQIAILSLANWEHYTSLPIENGFLFFLARFVAHQLHRPQRHYEATGCLQDFTFDKTGIDRCLKMGHICETCKKATLEHIQSNPTKLALFDDVIRILDAVANTSRWGQSVFRILEDTTIKDLNWSSFEDVIADYYRSLGAEVKQNINIAGFQIDVFFVERTPSGDAVRFIVECKFHRERVGNRVVNDFARIAATIKEANLADRGIIVSYSGFTQDAHLAAQHSDIKLLHYKDITNRFDFESFVPERHNDQSQRDQPAEVFVIMPFSSDLDDLYYFGIHETIRECGATCVRLDQMAFTGGILEKIYEHLQSARLIVAEVSQHNANVYYELGYAHACKKPVILLTNDLDKAPFDISGFNHIVYENIKDLRTKLNERLKVLLETSSPSPQLEQKA